MIDANDVILFQGDSITDAGRGHNIEASNKPHGLGHGYASKIAARLLADRPADSLTCYNRGISGHRVVDLYARWKIDALNLKPNLISILIGVNDTWHEFMRDNGVEIPRYEMMYRHLLAWTRESLPDVKLVLCEPFVLKCGVVTDAWAADIRQRQEIVAKLADEFGAKLVQFQAMFDDALQQAPAEYWAEDGVHPTPAGHCRMADLWLHTVCG